MARFTFNSAKRRAGRIAHDPEKLQELLAKAIDKIRNLDKGSDSLHKLMEHVNTFVRMIRAYMKGEYKAIPWKSILLIVAGLVYFVNPLDLVPDFIPGLGLVDDISIILWIFNSLQSDIEAFRMWESEVYTS